MTSAVPRSAGEAAGASREWIDTHCHLNLPQFDHDREEVIERAIAAGVSRIICPGITIASSGEAVALADRVPEVYAAVGVHPNDCEGLDSAGIAALRELAQHPKVVAIGEIGLDYYWKRVAPDAQKEGLRAQLWLAAELGLPVILHSRESNTDLLCEMAQWWPQIRTTHGSDAMVGVWHAFSGDLAEAERAWEMGLAVGLGGPVTFLNARRLHGLVPSLRVDRLVAETDAPYLAPHPHRGQRNEPGYVPLVGARLASLRGVPATQVALETTEVALRCFWSSSG